MKIRSFNSKNHIKDNGNIFDNGFLLNIYIYVCLNSLKKFWKPDRKKHTFETFEINENIRDSFILCSILKENMLL